MFPHVAELSEALELLGLSEDCTLEELKGAYKQHALRTHPDKNPGNSDATAEFQRVGEAYKMVEARLESSPFFAGGFDPFYTDIDVEDIDDIFYECSDFEDFEYDYSDGSDSDSDYVYHRLPRDFMNYLLLFEAINSGHYRCNCSGHGGEPVSEHQAAAEARCTTESAASKERQVGERERERVDAERRKKAKAKEKKAQAKVHRRQAEEAVNVQQRRTQELRSVAFTAARTGNAEKVKNAIWKDGVDASGGEVKYEKFIQNVPSDPLETLLHITAKKGDFELFQWLDAHNAEVDERDSRGYTALHLAIYHGRIPMVKYIFENYPPKEPEHKQIYDTPTRSNLIYLAVQSGEPELVWMILENGLFNEQDIRSGLSWASQAYDVRHEADDSKLKIENGRIIFKLLKQFGGSIASPGRAVARDEVQETHNQDKENVWQEQRSAGRTTTSGRGRDSRKRGQSSQFGQGRGQKSTRRGGRGRGRPWQSSS